MRMYSFLTSLVCLLIGLDAVADMAPPSPLVSGAKQEGENVRVTLSSSYGCYEMSDLTLVRENNGEETVIKENITLGKESADNVSFSCWFIDYEGTYGDDPWYHHAFVTTDDFCALYPDQCLECPGADNVCIGDTCDNCKPVDSKIYPKDFPPDFCELYPAFKVDCDDDGVSDCCHACYFSCYQEFIDECVPPGETNYYIEDEILSSKTIDVVSVNGTCGQDGAMPDATSGVIAEDGCQVAVPGHAKSVGWWQLIYMTFWL